MNKLDDISRFISLILRHKPENVDISLDEHGCANVSELISGISETRNFELIRDIQQKLMWN